MEHAHFAGRQREPSHFWSIEREIMSIKEFYKSHEQTFRAMWIGFVIFLGIVSAVVAIAAATLLEFN